MQYIDFTQHKDQHQETRRPHHTQTTEWLNTTDILPTITTQRFLSTTWHRSKATLLNQTNGHLDVQVYVQIRVTRHILQVQNFTPFPNEIGTPFFTKQEQMIITNH